MRNQSTSESGAQLERKDDILINSIARTQGLRTVVSIGSQAPFELGYAHALGKKICGYVSHLETQAARVMPNEGRAIAANGDHARITDLNGLAIENFGLPCNLMLAVPMHIIEGGLEACLQSLRGRSANAA